MAISSSIIDTSIDYEAIKKWLSWGEIVSLARKNKVSRSSAYKILKGEQKNFDFLEICMQAAIINAAKFSHLSEKLQAAQNLKNS
jgi:hypothetical protein